MVALDNEGFPIAFQYLMRRFKRIRNIANMTQRIPLTLYLFDILYLNGESLISLPYLNAENLGTKYWENILKQTDCDQQKR